MTRVDDGRGIDCVGVGVGVGVGRTVTSTASSFRARKVRAGFGCGSMTSLHHTTWRSAYVTTTCDSRLKHLQVVVILIVSARTGWSRVPYDSQRNQSVLQRNRKPKPVARLFTTVCQQTESD
jgi:hypothetical protein